MEFSNKISDITYMSELTPAALFRFVKQSGTKRNSGGLIRTITYVVAN